MHYQIISWIRGIFPRNHSRRTRTSLKVWDETSVVRDGWVYPVPIIRHFRVYTGELFVTTLVTNGYNSDLPPSVPVVTQQWSARISLKITKNMSWKYCCYFWLFDWLVGCLDDSIFSFLANRQNRISYYLFSGNVHQKMVKYTGYISQMYWATSLLIIW